MTDSLPFVSSVDWPAGPCWTAIALSGERAVWDIGQLNKTDVAALNREAKAGRLVRHRAHWCGLALKTFWAVPGCWPAHGTPQGIAIYGKGDR
jgi:hypothetical protein